MVVARSRALKVVDYVNFYTQFLYSKRLGVHFSFIFRIMVRRRGPKSKVSRAGPRPLDKRDARIDRWNTLEDIPMDEEDQCALFLPVQLT